MNAVPFQISGVFGGFGECHGLLKHEGKFLILEFQIQDNLVKVIKSGIKSVEIPLADIARVSLRRRWFGLSNSVEVQLSRMDLAEKVPGMKHGRIALAIYRHDVQLANELIEDIQSLATK
jgi:hypothetical protein